MEMVTEGAKTQAAKNALRQVQELKSIINQMREQKEYAPKILEIEAQGILEIKKDLLSNSKKEQERINIRLAQLEKEYSKNLKENPINTESIIARFRGMTDKELNTEASKMIINPRNNNPLIADYLSAELRARGNDNHSILREKLVEVDYQRPWLHSDEGQALQREATFYEHSKPGDFLIEATNMIGKTTTTAVSVQGLYDELQ